MIIAYGMFILALVLLFIIIISRNEWTEVELGTNIIIWFIIALISAQYIWG